MQVMGIIAEYNPFHLGHLYHLNKSKEICNSEYVIAIISGSFLQRGEPGLINKWARAEMALRAGVDLVLELPTVFSCRSAYWFAQGGVKSLAATGVVSYISFGAETSNLESLENIAQNLNNEDPVYRELLGSFLALGYSYPKARLLTLKNHIPENNINQSFLDSPNNILAIAYLRVLQELNSKIKPVLIPRMGSFHNPKPESNFASATAIRDMLLKKDQSWKNYVPPTTAQIMGNETTLGRNYITLKSLEQALFTVLRRMKISEISKIIEVTEGLEYRLKEVSQQTGDVDELLKQMKTKRYTYTRMQRLLIHTFLNFTQDLSVNEPQYLRVLGLNTKGKKLLKLMRKTSELPIINKFAQGYQKCSPLGKKMLDFEILATDLYNLGHTKERDRLARQDFYRSPLIIE